MLNTPVIGGVITAAAARIGTSDAVDEKNGWVRDAAGDRFDQLEFNITGFVTRGTDDVEATAAEIGGRISPAGSSAWRCANGIVASPTVNSARVPNCGTHPGCVRSRICACAGRPGPELVGQPLPRSQRPHRTQRSRSGASRARNSDL
jgi:hypothetical protein